MNYIVSIYISLPKRLCCPASSWHPHLHCFHVSYCEHLLAIGTFRMLPTALSQSYSVCYRATTNEY